MRDLVDDLVVSFASNKNHYPVVNYFLREIGVTISPYDYTDLLGIVEKSTMHESDYYNPRTIKCYKISVNDFLDELGKITGIDYSDKFKENFLK